MVAVRMASGAGGRDAIASVRAAIDGGAPCEWLWK
jgi:hypothetical protein